MGETLISYDKALPEVPGRTPYTRPDAYLEKLEEGDYAVRQGRRPSNMFLVDELRAAVDDWRYEGYPGASDITQRLFHFWFDEDHLTNDGTPWRYWWCQREAIETLVYLVEVRGFTDFEPLAQAFGETPEHSMLEMDFNIETTMDGDRLLRRWIPELEKDAVQDLPQENLPRYAFKMATGTGKTVVMAMVIVWSYYHRLLVPGSRQANNFLVVAPNVIVFDRLESDFANNEVFHRLPLIPPEWRGQWAMKVTLRGESAPPAPEGNLFVVNIQQIYESREKEWTPSNALDAILGQPPNQDLATYEPSMLERIKGLNNLMVLNDEAHHVHDDELAWNQTLLAIHENLRRKRASSASEDGGRGLTLWLDFSATPKTQAGTYYPWIVVDYPLAQAIEDQIVKAPLIVHRVEEEAPSSTTADTVVQAYHDWILVALERWKEHTEVYGGVGQKPVLFIMCERISYADAIGEYIRQYTQLRDEEVLVIHTDANGRVKEWVTSRGAREKIEALRDAARDIDKPESDIKVIVSVLMLREGWDVHNVTIVLGLRPFTARSRILPEQAVGRGLRLMDDVSPDRRQTLEVIGTEPFEEFVRELEQEGVGIDTVSDPPPLPIKIYPVQEKKQYDIVIPLTKPKYTHQYRRLDTLDPLQLSPIYDAGVLEEEIAIEIMMAFATTGTSIHRDVIRPEHPLLSQKPLREITQKVERRLSLDGHFAVLYGIVKRYVRYRCFGTEVDLESEDVKRRLRDPMLQKGIATFLSREIAKLAAEERKIEFEDAAYRLSQAKPFTWRRKHVKCKKTIFSDCAVFNDLELRFAEFLDGAEDITRFAALAESYTRFRVDYLSKSGAIKFYYPDFVAVQQTTQGKISWIIETKGREYEDVQHKDASIREWCDKITNQTRRQWCYLKVPQTAFDVTSAKTFEGLVQQLTSEEPQLLG
jgi:type III restriction enzyme